MLYKFSNAASAPIATSITSTATAIPLPSGLGSLFPALSVGQAFTAAIFDETNNVEFVRVTARAGDNLTVTRGQEGSTAKAFTAASRLEHRITAETLSNMVQVDALLGYAALTGNQSIAGTKTFSEPIVGSITGNAATATLATNATTAALANSVANAALDKIYPVGSVYINATNATNPTTLLGFGTWVSFGAGRVPVGVDGSDTLFDAPEKTGGSKDAIVVSHTHTANVNETPHSHGLTNDRPYGGYGAGGTIELRASPPQAGITGTTLTGITVSNSATGSSGTNANIQPFIAVYMWKRTA